MSHLVIPAPRLPASQLPGVWKGSPPSPTMAGHDGPFETPRFPKRHNFSCLCFPLAQAPGLTKPSQKGKETCMRSLKTTSAAPYDPWMNHGVRIRPIVAFLDSGDWWRFLGVVDDMKSPSQTFQHKNIPSTKRLSSEIQSIRRSYLSHRRMEAHVQLAY